MAEAQEKNGQTRVTTDGELTGSGNEGKGEFIKSSNKYSLDAWHCSSFWRYKAGNNFCPHGVNILAREKEYKQDK